MIVPAPSRTGTTYTESKGTSVAEFKAMVTFGRLTRATMIPSMLFRLIRELELEHDGEGIEMLRGLNPIAFGGTNMTKGQYDKAREIQRMDLDVLTTRSDFIRCIYSFPTSPMRSPIHYRFDPVSGFTSDDSEKNLVELVILSISSDIPDGAFLDSEGNFHTGDIFSEHTSVSDPFESYYIHRGRKDDWIKMESGDKCDAGSIEKDARAACQSLSGFKDCIIIGSGRPSPVLVVEFDLQASTSELEAELKKDIFHRIQTSPATQWFPHEKIASPDSIIVVPARSLSRTATKGVIRRKAVEEDMREKLDEIFGENA
ncbi:hypothetical protein AAF712_013173 [Marasmius tenuissimus]|uniref:Uncharacterized protein n=1 Tax=Marasmius tenuissimus TaxID=585030 RepID=A0ABR2ZFL5_9AGAR